MKTPKIEVTNDYSIFNFAYFNRKVDRLTVKKLKAEYEKEDNFPYFPLVVDLNYNIIDGQHRFQACKELSLPIYYILKNDRVTPDAIRTVNKAGRKHSIYDIFEMEYKSGNPEAVKAKRIIDKFESKVSPSAILAMSLNVGYGGGIRDCIEKGEFKVFNENLVIILCESLLRLTGGRYVTSTIYNSVSSVAKKNNINIISLADHLTEKGLNITQRLSKVMIINKIIETYNHGKHKDNRIVTI